MTEETSPEKEKSGGDITRVANNITELPPFVAKKYGLKEPRFIKTEKHLLGSLTASSTTLPARSSYYCLKVVHAD